MQNRLRLEGQLSKLQRVPEEPPPTNGHISDVLHSQTRATHPRHRHTLASARLVPCASGHACTCCRGKILPATWG